MRCYIISVTWSSGGGAGGVAADIFRVMTKNGHLCRFAYARGDIPANINKYKIGTMLDVYVHAISARIFDNAGFMSDRATDELIKDIIEFNPDVISIQNPLGYCINVEILMNFLRKSRITTYWTLHDCWAITGHCITGLCENLKTGCGNCPRKHEFPTSYFRDASEANLLKKKKIMKDISNLHFITPSKWLAELAGNSHLKNYTFNVIPNGIDLSIFCPRESDFREKYNLKNKIVILAVANIWAKFKGASYFYKLSEALDEKYAFVMIGKNSDSELKNNSRIIHISRTANQLELSKWYTLADVFVNVTMGDNFPTVNLEALACGTPIVTFDTGGSGEAVGNCGEIVPAGNVEALIQGIKKCIKRKISSKECLARAGLYNKEDRFKEYIDLYNCQGD